MTTQTRYTLLLTCCLAAASVLADEQLFQQIRDDVFGSQDKGLAGKHVSWRIGKMIELLSSGDIPNRMQGSTTLDYLNSVAADCTATDRCDLKADVAKAHRLIKRETGAPGLHAYLERCTLLVMMSCAGKVFEETDKKLGSLEDDDWARLNRFASTVEHEAEPRYGKQNYREERSELELNYPELMLINFEGFDPSSDTGLAQVSVDQVRQSCNKFLQNLSPAVALYPSGTYVSSVQDPIGQVRAYSFLKRSCEQVNLYWKAILATAKEFDQERMSDSKHEDPNSFWDNMINLTKSITY